MAGFSVVLLALGAAAAYAVAANLKHASASQVPDVRGWGRRSVGRFVRATLTHRLWLSSIVLDLVGVSLQILALRRGALAVVQPLLVSGLVIALVLRARSGGHVSRREIVWGVVLCVALGGFLTVAHVSAGVTAVRADVRPAAVMGILGLLLAAACVAAARRWRGRRLAAALLGLAVGVIDASTATMLKALTSVAAHGPVAVLASWQLYALIALGASAMFLNQVAFQAGPLSASLPMISSVDPLVSVVIGVSVFDESMRHGPLALTCLIGLLVALVTAIVALSRVPGEKASPLST